MSLLEQLDYMNFMLENNHIDYSKIDHEYFEKLVSDESRLVEKKITSKEFWNILKNTDTSLFQKRCKYVRYEFGTTDMCNRFMVGFVFERFFADLLKSKFVVVNEHNAKRIDINIKNYKKISVKYISKGNIRLHNSLGANKDMMMHTTIIIRPREIFLISPSLLKEIGIDVNEYLKNTGDALILKESLLTRLKKVNFFYMLNIDITVEKCKNRQGVDLLYNYVVDTVK
jgi:hypothetical protein